MPSCDLVSLPTCSYLESLLTISLNIDLLLDLLTILSLMFFEEVLVYQNSRKTLTHIQFRSISLIGFPAQSILVTRASQSRHHESRKSPTAELFDVDTGRISIVTVNTKEYHSDVLEIIPRIMRWTLV
ncbi:hypothetical protein Tco_1136965 [Tanacetum coccineum]